MSSTKKDAGNPEWKCQYCDKSYTIKHSMQDHIRRKHKTTYTTDKKSFSKEKEHYKCNYCGKQYIYREPFLCHLQEHDADENDNTKLDCSSQSEPSTSTKIPIFNPHFQTPVSESLQSFGHFCSLCLREARIKYEQRDFAKQLSIFYLVHKLLDLPLDLIQNYFVNYGNPLNWIILCDSCDDILQEAQDINKKIMKLQNELNSLKFKLKVPMTVKTEPGIDLETEQYGKATNEIRQYILRNDNLSFDTNSEHFTIHTEMNEATVMGFEINTDAPSDMDSEWETETTEEYKAHDDNVLLLSADEADSKNKPICLTGDKLEKTLKAGGVWKCPVCTLKYSVRRTWREHIRRNHKPFLLHLDNNVPDDHVCVPGKCLSPNKLKIKTSLSKVSRKPNKSTAKVKPGNLSLQIPFIESNIGTDSRPRRSITLNKHINYSTLLGSPEQSENDSDWNMEGNDEVNEKAIIENEDNISSSSLDLKTNLIVKQKSEDLKWECKFCAKQFKLKHSLKDHIRKKHSEAMDALNKPISTMFKYLGENNDEDKLQKGKTWECSLCLIHSKSRRSTFEHIRRKHKQKANELKEKGITLESVCKFKGKEEDLNFQCSICGKCYNKDSSLSSHVRRKHDIPNRKNNEKDVSIIKKIPFPLSSEKIGNYIITYDSKENYKCHLCPQSFLTHKSLMIHLTLKHKRKISLPQRISPCSQPEINIKEENVQYANLDKDIVPGGKTKKMNQNNFGRFAKNLVHRATSFLRKPSQSITNQKEEIIDNLGKPTVLGHTRTRHRTSFTCSHCGKFISDLPRHMLHVHGIKAKIERQTLQDEKKDWLTILREFEETTKSQKASCSAKVLNEKKIANMQQNKKYKPHRITLGILSRKYKIEEFPCTHCDKVFTTFTEWRIHNEADHSTGFKCETCGRVLATTLNLENHVRSFHHPASISICTGCGKTYKKADKFNLHIRREANPLCIEKSVSCLDRQCKTRNYRLTSQESLDLHMEISHFFRAPAPYKCSFCERTFNFKAKWIEHENTHSVKESYICEICGKTFILQRRLQAHIQEMHTENQKEYPCPDCGKIFRRSGSRARHQKLHLSDTPYMCNLCGKTFKIRNYLTLHMWSHDPDRRLKYSLYKPRPKKDKSETNKSIVRKPKSRRVVELGPPKADSRIETKTEVTCQKNKKILPKRKNRKNETSESESSESSYNSSSSDSEAQTNNNSMNPNVIIDNGFIEFSSSPNLIPCDDQNHGTSNKLEYPGYL